LTHDVLEEASPVVLRTVSALPGPKGIPIFGNALQIKINRLHLQMEDWAKEFGPYYTLTLGGRKILVVADHKAVGKLLRDRPEGFNRSTKLGEIWEEMDLPTGVFGANGEVWRRQRRMVMAGFDPVHVKRYFPLCSRCRSGSPDAGSTPPSSAPGLTCSQI
jgi:cytochrome P450